MELPVSKEALAQGSPLTTARETSCLIIRARSAFVTSNALLQITQE
jgi:hypothetical protein